MADVCKLSMYIYIYIYIYIFPSISILSPCDSPFPSPGLTDETRREGGEGHHQQQQRHGPVTGQTKGVGHRQDACETAAKRLRNGGRNGRNGEVHVGFLGFLNVRLLVM